MTAARTLAIGAVCAALGLGVAPASHAEVPTTVCGSPLSDSEISTIADLSDTTHLSGNPLQRLETGVDDLHRITEILVAHQDRRGLFALGLDIAEQQAVMPLQRDPAAFDSPDYAHAISLELLRRYLDNLHAEFTGGTVEPHWAEYYALARRCEVSGAQVAMVGYNAHITVDLAYSVAAVGTRPSNAADYFMIVDAIASSGPALVDRTKAAYGVDLGPLWRLYFFGEGLDLLAGQGVATGALLRLADGGYNVIVFGNGMALQDPALHDATAAEIRQLFDTANVAFEVLAALRGL
ncbi:hypothetical protein BJY24_003918 [Nocardia transvalensis]|uniref:Uncharacterized protein n=1 Tax=Nocardia transvalensis TaxID=37333 RepID=A0A7W9PFI1_9NOCA|nr:DUF5995 family protein [Nocardia transvalensis]MBB5915051.1 hypothetical protein [Nocardia transvalensis]